MLLTPVLIALAGFLVHARGFVGSEFTFDDVPIVAENPLLHLESLADLRPLLTTDYWRRPDGAERLWRPLSLITLALERRVHGGSADAYHLTNALLHGLIAAGLYGLFHRLLGSRRAAALGAGLFALHPVHAEASAGIVGRSELLALGLCLAAWSLHLRGRELAAAARRLSAIACYGLAGSCFFLAATSKEIALAAPFVLIALERIPRRASRGRWAAVWPYLLYLLAIGAYLGCRAWVLDDLVARAGGRTLGGMPIWDRLLVASWVYLDAQLSLLIPHVSAAHYPFGGAWLDPLLRHLGQPRPGFPPQTRLPSWDAPATALPLLLHGAALAAGWLALRRPQRWLRGLGAAVWGFYLALGPVSNLLVPIGVIRADRLLYLPSALFALGAGAVGWRLLRSRSREAWCFAVAAVGAPCALLLSHNVHSWTHDRALWERTVAAYPGEPRSLIGLATTLLASGRPDLAEPLLAEAAAGTLTGTPLSVKALGQWGHALLALDRLDAAEQAFVAARQHDSGDEAANVGLANLYMRRAETAPADRAQRYVRLAVRVAQEGTRANDSYRLWLTLGSALARLPRREVEAELAYDRAIEREQRPWQALANRAVIRLRLNDAEGAALDYAQVVRLLDQVPPSARTPSMWLVTIDSTRALRELARLGGSSTEPYAAAFAALEADLRSAPLPPPQRESLLRHLAAQR